MAEISLSAEAAEQVIRLGQTRRKYTDPDACAAYISEMAKAQKVPYVLPRAVRLTGRVTEKSAEGLRYFLIGGSHTDGERSIKIMYLHGGSYFAPPNIFHWDMLLHLADLTGAEISVPLYPRAPLRTCSAAYEELENFARSLPCDVLMGDSAGGGLALGLAQVLGEDAPDRLILLSPWLDVTLTNPEIPACEPIDAVLGSYGLRRMGKVWAGSLDVLDPRVSPIYGSFSLRSEITLAVGTHEIFFPDVMKLSKMLSASKKSHRLIIGEGMGHVWCCYPTKEGRESLAEIAAVIKLY